MQTTDLRDAQDTLDQVCYQLAMLMSFISNRGFGEELALGYQAAEGLYYFLSHLEYEIKKAEAIIKEETTNAN